jgi:hydrogenase maturation protease
MKILVYGYGNPGRQDDGLGIRLSEELENWAHMQGINNVTFDKNYQLNAEDALLASEHDVVIFADAAKHEDESFNFNQIKPARKIAFTTHAMNPESVLALCGELYKKSPKAYMLSINGVRWEVAETMTPEAERNLGLALEFVKQKLLNPDTLM